jgi:hypothetical protein
MMHIIFRLSAKRRKGLGGYGGDEPSESREKASLSGSRERKIRLRSSTQLVHTWFNRHKHTMSKTREVARTKKGLI